MRQLLVNHGYHEAPFPRRFDIGEDAGVDGFARRGGHLRIRVGGIHGAQSL